MTTNSPQDPTQRARLDRLLGFLARDPDNLNLRADIFDAALAAGVFDEAQGQVVWALTRQPVDPGWRHRLAVLDMARQEWDEARTLLEGLEAEGLGGPVVRYNLAYVDFAQARFADAEARLAPLVEQSLAEVPQSLSVLVSCQHRRGAPEEAVATFAKWGGAVNSASAFGAASLAALDASQAPAAGAWAGQALRLDSRQPEAIVAQATLLLGGRDAAGALALLAPLLARAPGDGRALSTAAMAEMLAARLPQARALFQRAVAAMPGHIGTWLAYGWCELFMGDRAAARRAFETGMAIDPTFGESHGAVAVVDALDGRQAEAREGIRRATGLDPRGLSAAYAQAILDGEAHDSQRFLALAQRVLGRHTAPGGKSLAEVVLAPR